MRVLARKRSMFLGAGKDAEEQQKQCNRCSDQQEERFAFVSAKFLTSRGWFLLPACSLERCPKGFAPVPFANLFLLRLFVQCLRRAGCLRHIPSVLCCIIGHGLLPPSGYSLQNQSAQAPAYLRHLTLPSAGTTFQLIVCKGGAQRALRRQRALLVQSDDGLTESR